MDELHEVLQETAVLSRLSTRWLGRHYHYFPAIPSTNDYLKQRLAEVGQELPHGMVVLADYQSRGRGRLQREWVAPAGTSLLLSMLFWPDWPPEQGNWLAMMGSVAAAEAMEELTGVSVGIKWPNDLMIELDGVWHKVSGLLLEGNLDENGRLQSAILGIGMNVNMAADQLPPAVTPATSLLIASGHPMDRVALLVAFLARMEQYYEAAVAGTSPRPAWHDRLITIGQMVQVSGQMWQVKGVAEGTDEWGRLLVRAENGRLHTIAAGDVTLRPH